MIIKELHDRGLCNPPKWLATNTQMLTIMGSIAYGVSSDTSDYDVYGFCIPKREEVFPHLAGEILGFGKQKERFGQWQEHHIHDQSAMGGHGRTYDFTVFGIVKLFSLAMDCNPNVIDCLFTPANCVIHSTKVGNMVRENRKLFLHKGAWHRFKGYAYSQLHKMASKTPNGKRLELVEKYGYDVKFAYHVLRLLDEAEQIMMEGDIDLQRNREELKSIRRGEWTEDYLRKVAAERERGLEEVYKTSTLQHSPDESKIKALLVSCLEEHYGSLSNCYVEPNAAFLLLQDLKDVVNRWDKNVKSE